MPAGSNNPFGIKTRPGDEYVESSTQEFENGQFVTKPQRFRKLKSLEEAFDEHARLLATGSLMRSRVNMRLIQNCMLMRSLAYMPPIPNMGASCEAS
jgi:flagellum-specific peptidoglycan hydrolase FlgJ